MRSRPRSIPERDGISAARSALMAKVKAKNTKPEIVVRSITHRLGFRFRLHRKDLPGSPDLVFPKLNKIIFVHGCFWHRHPGCSRTTNPKTRADYWQAKFESNKRRDKIALKALRLGGWKCFVVWECETFDQQELKARLKALLSEH